MNNHNQAKGNSLSSIRTEKSAGFLIFKRNGTVRYLFLKIKGRFDVPKGLQQPGEDDLTCAMRELKEETGITNATIIPRFKKTSRYFYRWENSLVRKEVVYFLAECKSGSIRVSEEHDGYTWMTKEEVLVNIRYQNLKELVEEADRTIRPKSTAQPSNL
jgi:8-oxo-dGTP pyrophosphatase MutT (NUDIX family)